MVRTHTIEQAMEQAADTLLTVSPDGWVEWICYILEALEAECKSDCDFQGMLAEVKARIENRLEDGHW